MLRYLTTRTIAIRKKMHFLQLFAYFVIFLLQKSLVTYGGFCGNSNNHRVMKICTNSTKTSKRSIFIEYDQVPTAHDISCKCNVSTSSDTVHNDELIFIANISERSKMEFKIHENVLDSKSKNLYIDDNEELTFFSHGSHNKTGGVCLSIITNNPDRFRFTVTCFKASTSPMKPTTARRAQPIKTTTATPVKTTTTTTATTTLKTIKTSPIKTRTATTSPIKTTTKTTSTIKTTEPTTNQSNWISTGAKSNKQRNATTTTHISHSSSTSTTTQTIVSRKDSKGNDNKTILVSSATGISGLVFGLLTGIICMFCCKRVRKIKSVAKQEPDGGINMHEFQANEKTDEMRTMQQTMVNAYNHAIEIDVENNQNQTYDCANIPPTTKRNEELVKETDGDSIYNRTTNTLPSFHTLDINVYDHLRQVDKGEMCSNDIYDRTGKPGF